MKYYIKPIQGGAKIALDISDDRIRTLIPMTTDSFHRVIMIKTMSPCCFGCFTSNLILLILTCNKDTHRKA